MEAPKSHKMRYGAPSTTISLRESKATSQWWKKNTAPAKQGEEIVSAGIKMPEVYQQRKDCNIVAICCEEDKFIQN